MFENTNEHMDQTAIQTDTTITEDVISENATDTEKTPKKKLSKKKLGIIGAVVAVIAVVAAIVLIPSKFERVQNECLHIAHIMECGDGYFILETIGAGPNASDRVRELMKSQSEALVLEAIRYANAELGFSDVYWQMLNTNALMGRQTEENDKYKVTWYYDPDKGLTVTYSKK